MTPSPSWQADLMYARDGDRDALGRILDAVRDYLRRVARRELPDNLRAKEDESDLVQQTFAEASASFDHFRGTCRHELEAWLRRILLDNVSNFRREFRAQQAPDQPRTATGPNG